MLVTGLTCIIAKSLPVLELQDRDPHMEGLHIVNRAQKEKNERFGLIFPLL